ncbi:OprD family outer membrane porin [Desulfogranum mediterraneum]|uniref:OprD family outer membrane porin n=1 Tax=Desulfogranum mediterraneum TaxID=160661 RepID=UPI00041D7682|nr:OprD family outer membrane porin [Desulfogranum mediterraneum]
MKKTTISLVTASILIGSMAPAQATEEATSFTEMFTKGTPSGQIRLGYIWLDPEEDGAKSTYDLALGGQLKFETAALHGLSLGAAFYTSHSIIQPDDENFNDELSSPAQHYDLLAEAYINGGWEDFNIRVGRQLIDTPFADSDDIRMTPHTFEAAVADYAYNDFSVTGGYLSTWQGVDAGYHNDADFDDMVAGSDGTWMLGGSYGSDLFEAGLWFYSVTDVVDVFYADIVAPITLGEDITLTLGLQAVVQSDNTNLQTSGEIGSRVEGNLYGAMAELSVIGITAGIAYDHASVDEGEALFGGWGGGPFFTNIDTLVANEFAAGQDADSYTLSLGYDFSDIGVEGLSLGYTFGHYEGGTDPMDNTADAEVDEHNLYVEYEITEAWSVDAVYVVSDDKENDAATEWDYNRAQVRVNFTF